MKRNFKKRIIQWGIAGSCFGYILLTLWQQRAYLQTIVRIDPLYLLMILLLLVCYYFLHAYRFRIILQKCSNRYLPYREWFRIFILGLFLNNFIPQMGNVYRSILLKRDHDLPITGYVSSYVSFAWMDLCINMILAGTVVSVTNPALRFSGMKVSVTVLLFGGAFAVMVLPVVIFFLGYWFDRKFHRRIRLYDKLSGIVKTTLYNLKDLKYVAAVVALGIIVFFEMSTIFLICFRSLGLHSTWSTMALFYALYKVSIYFNITPGNIGVRELAYGLLSEKLHFGMTEGLLVAAVFRVFVYIALFGFAIPMGGIDLLRRKGKYHPPEKT
ncbi:MAG: flippase-like domain-containing protein [Chitinispirillaceae bacterium]|nr:flippase-like domain-containing protein [Chitinispirillaceae bacterium]